MSEFALLKINDSLHIFNTGVVSIGNTENMNKEDGSGDAMESRDSGEDYFEEQEAYSM